MVIGIEGADDARQRLYQRAFKVAVALVAEQAVLFHHLVWDQHMGGFTAHVREGIPRAIGAIRQLQVGLNHVTATGSELVLPFFADAQDLAAELMANNDRVFRHVIRHLFMVGTLVGFFPGGKADAVGHYRCQDFILRHVRQCKLLKAQIVFAIQA